MNPALMAKLKGRAPGASSKDGQTLADAAGLHPDGYSPDELLGGKAKEDVEEEETPALAGAGRLLPKIRANGAPKPGGMV